MNNVIPFPNKIKNEQLDYISLLEKVYIFSLKMGKNEYTIDDLPLGIALYKEVYNRCNGADVKMNCILNIGLLESLLEEASQ